VQDAYIRERGIDWERNRGGALEVKSLHVGPVLRDSINDFGKCCQHIRGDLLRSERRASNFHVKACAGVDKHQRRRLNVLDLRTVSSLPPMLSSIEYEPAPQDYS